MIRTPGRGWDFPETSPERCRDLRSQPAMRLRKLGNTGLTASEVSLGTAEIGLDYGFKGSPQYARPSVQDSIRLIRRAVDRGINWLDTARAYGNSEEVIGQALKDASPRPRISSKVIFDTQVGVMDSASLRQWVYRID